MTAQEAITQLKARRTMTPKHPYWHEFCAILGGPEGCNFREEDGDIRWDCEGKDKPRTEAILKKHFPEVDLVDSFCFFERHCGFCDCEVLFNVKEEFWNQAHLQSWFTLCPQRLYQSLWWVRLAIANPLGRRLENLMAQVFRKYYEGIR